MTAGARWQQSGDRRVWCASAAERGKDGYRLAIWHGPSLFTDRDVRRTPGAAKRLLVQLLAGE